MHYNAYMAELFPRRRQFYVLQRLADPDADALIEMCTMHWQGGWELGDVVCGDETSHRPSCHPDDMSVL